MLEVRVYSYSDGRTQPYAHGEEQALTSQESSQCFTCEIDDRDDMQCALCGDDSGAMELAIIFTSCGEIKGGITIGRDQIQNLIDYLEQIKHGCYA